MGTTSHNEQGASKIAAALVGALKGLAEVRESQKRIEDQQKKSGEELARQAEHLKRTENGLEQAFRSLRSRIDWIEMAAKELLSSIEHLKVEKKPVRWKHHLRAVGVVLGALGIGLLVGWLWALSWVRTDETERKVLDEEREVGHALMMKVKRADDEQLDQITAPLTSADMSSEYRQRVRKWLGERSEMANVGRARK
jgi:hypothetical protein